MTRIARNTNPLGGVNQVLVDGSNLHHALSRGPGGGARPPAALIGRLRAAIPAEASIVLVFDGPPERGVRGERIAGGLTVRYSGRFSADTILVTLVEEAALASASPVATDQILVVTDDRELRFALRRRGARTAGTAWLIGRLERSRLATPSVGNPRPARPRGPGRIAQPPPRARIDEAGGAGGGGQSGRDRTDDGPDDEARDGASPWSPGRGATVKRGNPRREPKGGRAGRPNRHGQGGRRGER